jgi:tetratricopeptide (TPR) repeat protein
MKKLMIMLVLLVAGIALYAQKAERTNAFMYNKNGQYDKAREAIDKAIVHEKTINDARTWIYRGIIYLNIVFSEEYKALDENALEKSFESFVKARQLDPADKEGMGGEITVRIEAIGQRYFEKGVEDFNVNDLKASADNFKKAFDVAQVVQKTDTLALLNAALSSVRGEEYDRGISYYSQLLEMNFSEPDIYKNMALAYRSLGDNDKMFATIEEGRTKYPDDAGLLLEEINAYLAIGQGEKVVDDLKLLVEKDPTNYSVFFVLGTIYGDELNADMFNMETAEKYYMRAIELKPDYFDAIYNIGALYINESNKLQVKANDLPLADTKGYEKITEEANVIIRKALPYLEQAHEMQPSNQETITVLRTIYIRFKMDDKLKKLNE